MSHVAPQIAFAQARAADPAGWGRIAVEVGEQLSRSLPTARLGFLYATDALADRLEEVLAVVRRVSGIQEWVGAVGLGVIGEDEVFDAPALAAIALDVPADSFRVLPSVSDDPSILTAFGTWIAAKRPAFGILHADPRCPDLGDAIALIGDASDAFLVGGVSSGEKATAQIAFKVVEGGVSGVLFAHQVAVATGLTQGCTPIGPVRRVTAADGNVVISIDGRPALDVFKEDIGDMLARDLRQVAGLIHAAFPVPGSDRADYLVRNLVGIDPKEGLVAVGSNVEPGDRIMFVRRDAAAATQDMAEMLEGLKRRAPRAKAGIYFSCLARGPNLFGPGSVERRLLREALGDIPIVGMFCNGEISDQRLYGYTGVLALFV
ncbi:MAG: FIST C-terminal domain-containing protein [Rhodospirillales bacterium]|nr:FIST C-terminal domain-containing protein [Rhodospirillales bacterium]